MSEQQTARHISREEIEALIPHQGEMCLWDAVTAWDAQRICLRSDRHHDLANPLRSDNRLHAVHLCEYGAQAMAVHGGLRSGGDGSQGPKAGMLVALRDVVLHVACIDELPGALEGEAELLADSATSQQYVFRIRHAGAIIAEGRAAVLLQER